MPKSRLLAVAAFSAVAALTATADAQSIIKNPGDHPDYKVEAEPHLNFAWANRWASNGFGVGARFSIPIVQNGFIPSINNSVAISFGLDYLRYSGCYYSNRAFGNAFRDFGCGASFLLFPVAMQWNFWLSPKWSVFGEPGLYIYHGIYDDPCEAIGGNCSPPSRTSVDFLFHAGGRFHINDTVALTLRVGYPTISFGASFFF
jgi:hypothetical protein